MTARWEGLLLQPPDAGFAEVTAEHRAVLVALLAEFEHPFAHGGDIGLFGVSASPNAIVTG